jgi:molybdopterin-binding protein
MTESIDKVQNTASPFKKIVRWFFVLLILFSGVYGYWKYYFTYSDGYRSGLLQKMSHKGNVFKTYEGELVMSSIASKANVALASEKFLFSVVNDSLAKAMQLIEGKQVRLHYKQKNGTLPWRGDSDYIVDAAELEGAK